MRKTNTFEIEGYEKSFTVNELTIKEIISLIQEETLGGEKDSLDLAKLKENFETRLLPLCSNIKMSDLEDMAPSELKLIWEKFKEVNSDFFVIARKAGADKILARLKEALIADFSSYVVDSSSQDTSES
jgi:predicted nucleic acid-binding OB-fold protein